MASDTSLIASIISRLLANPSLTSASCAVLAAAIASATVAKTPAREELAPVTATGCAAAGRSCCSVLKTWETISSICFSSICAIQPSSTSLRRARIREHRLKPPAVQSVVVGMCSLLKRCRAEVESHPHPTRSPII